MAYNNILLDNGKGTYYKFVGILESDDFVNIVSQNLQNNFDRFVTLEYVIMDISNVSMIVITDNYLKKIVSLCSNLSKVNPNLIVITVTNRDEADKFSEKIFSEIAVTKWTLKSFKTYESALEWAKSIKEG